MTAPVDPFATPGTAADSAPPARVRPDMHIDVTTDGRMPSDSPSYARARIGAAASGCHRLIQRVQVRIVRYPDPLLPQPVVARANLNVDGRLVQAHAVGDDVDATIDALHDAVRTAIAARPGDAR